MIHINSEVISIHFKYDSDFLPVNVSEIYAFQINAFPQSQPIFDSMSRYLNRDNLTFYEDKEKIGAYHLEYCSHTLKMPSPIEATEFILSSNLLEPKKKRYKLTISYGCLGYKKSPRKEVAAFAYAISSHIRWKHEIVWFTEDGKRTIIIDKKSSSYR